MTAKEALWLLKVQLQQNEQNQEALKVLEGLINLPARHIDNEPQTLEELFDGYEEPRGCARYELAEDDEEDTSHALDHMFGNVLEDLENLKIKKGDK
jgi:hypothetical protein